MTSRVDTGHILGPKSHASIAILVKILLVMTMEIWERECGPFRSTFAVFAILGQVGNTISPWRKRPGHKGVFFPVAYAQGSTALEARICPSALDGVMQLTVHAAVPNFDLSCFSLPRRATIPSKNSRQPA